jgi:hypothetical protein
MSFTDTSWVSSLIKLAQPVAMLVRATTAASFRLLALSMVWAGFL